MDATEFDELRRKMQMQTASRRYRKRKKVSCKQRSPRRASISARENGAAVKCLFIATAYLMLGLSLNIHQEANSCGLRIIDLSYADIRQCRRPRARSYSESQ
uniref:Uncharacterized protein n=1 Tax=Hyaloperonospora arabidopsidis (strain Emoy2) TaxID=559515 RepID=M4C1Y7_HYAAE